MLFRSEILSADGYGLYVFGLNGAMFLSAGGGDTSGVVEGISHYGNCLSAHESFIWRDQREVHFDTIGNFVNGYWTETGDRHLQNQDKFLETLSFDPQTGKAGWQPITRLFKRVTNTLITLKMEQGYEITLTPDHPCCIIHDQNWQIKAAERIQTGDRIPFLLRRCASSI